MRGRLMGAVRKRREVAAEAAPFLGVSASARGYQWRERLTGEAQLRAAAISQRHGLPELLGRVLAGRGVAVDDVPVMLNPTLKALMPDPSSVRDMDAAAARLADAIEQRQSVAIFGDYDVDGASSAALMCRFFAHHGLKARIYIPDRLFEGYGPNPTAIEGLVKDGAQLIVTVDCGTTSRRAVGARRRARLRRHRHRPPPGRRGAAARLCRGQSEPAGRRVGTRAPVRGGRLLSRAGGDDARVASPRRLRQRCGGAGSDGRARPRGAGDGRRRRAAHGAKSRLRHARLAGDALAAQQRPQGAERCGRIERGADAVSPWLHSRPAYQRRRAHRRCRARRAPAGRRRRG